MHYYPTANEQQRNTVKRQTQLSTDREAGNTTDNGI